MAEQDYWAYTLEHPGEYFELVRVEHTEECLQHNGKPDVSPNACYAPAEVHSAQKTRETGTADAGSE
jgi:hypothetical protein